MSLSAALLLTAFISLTPSDSVRPPCVHTDSADSAAVCASAQDDTVPRRRPKAIEYSDWYARRLEIHRIGSYTMLPLFGAEYLLGQNLLTNGSQGGGVKGAHVLVGSAIGVLFTTNTVTGLWNLWDARADPAGRTRRTIHSLLMLTSDAGFLWATAVAGDAKRSTAAADHHRNIALGSMGISTIATAMMYLWKN